MSPLLTLISSILAALVWVATEPEKAWRRERPQSEHAVAKYTV